MGKKQKNDNRYETEKIHPESHRSHPSHWGPHHVCTPSAGGLECTLIPFPDVFINFFLIPMWVGIVIYQYRPELSLTTKRLSWASIVLFIISLVTMILSRGTWIHQASKIAITLSGLLAVIAWIKIYNENQYIKDDENVDNDKN